MKPMWLARRDEVGFVGMAGVLFCSLVFCHGDTGDGQQEGAESLEAVRVRIEKTDATVVPVLRRWLAEASDTRTVGEGNEKLFLALHGVGEYRLADCAALASFFYKQAPLRSDLRQIAADALAAMGSTENLEELKSIVWDQQLRLAVRCKAAAELVKLDDDLGRRFLLLQYDLYRLERKTMHGWNMDPVRDTLERIDDKKLMAALDARLGEETGTMQINITTLLARMAINAESVETLQTMAADPLWSSSSHAGRRYAAIEALGSKGDVKLIPFLQSLRPWEGIDANPEHIQQKYLKEYAENAVRAIRRRHWQQDVGSGITNKGGGI